MNSNFLKLTIEQASALQAQGMPEGAVKLYDALLSIYTSSKFQLAKGSFTASNSKVQQLCGIPEENWMEYADAKRWLIDNKYITYDTSTAVKGKSASTWSIIKNPFKDYQKTQAEQTDAALDEIWDGYYKVPEQDCQNKYQKDFLCAVKAIASNLNKHEVTDPMYIGEFIAEILYKKFNLLHASRQWAINLVNQVFGEHFMQDLFKLLCSWYNWNNYTMVERHMQYEDGYIGKIEDRQCDDVDADMLEKKQNQLMAAYEQLDIDNLETCQINNLYWDSIHLINLMNNGYHETYDDRSKAITDAVEEFSNIHAEAINKQKYEQLMYSATTLIHNIYNTCDIQTSDFIKYLPIDISRITVDKAKEIINHLNHVDNVTRMALEDIMKERYGNECMERIKRRSQTSDIIPTMVGDGENSEEC